ncbi:MAG: hypothetical protein M3024_07450 [Candidatus Dormibacteraeota bacterium]|nr:hypothetical protein [Candidatus Dormibacteraeota bacterium]
MSEDPEDGSTTGGAAPEWEDEPVPDTPADRRRMKVIAAFVLGSVVLALVLAVIYAQPSIG